MNFTDTLKIQASFYQSKYAKVGDNFFNVDSDGNITDKIDSDTLAQIKNDILYDSEGDSVTPTRGWLSFGGDKNCIILPNSSASKISLNDGTEYIYSYEIIAKLKSNLYSIIPTEGTSIRCIKYDNTIDKKMVVKGFMTLKKRYLKIWL